MKKLILLLGLCLFLNCTEEMWGGLSDFYIKEKCIKGHVYYSNDGFNMGGIALKVDDNGKPIKCEEK